ncbi:MAG TPA: hypothetical protein PLD23_09885 [Armatimonadota bacterium]|nr:hypothetical protein [Armatimonadota bacterium]
MSGCLATPISSVSALGLLAVWAAISFTATWLLARSGRRSAERFMVSTRSVSFGLGSVCLLASWVWALSVNAPAEAGFNYGIAGPLYFAVGGALMLVVMAPFAGRIRSLSPRGNTLPEFMGSRYGPTGRHVVLVINLLSVGVLLFLNLTVAGYLIDTLTALPYEAGVIAVAATTVGYVLIGGLAASIVTDALQFALLTLAALIIVPTIWANAGGMSVLSAAAPALGEKLSLLSPRAFWQMGLPFLVQSCVSAFAYPSLWQLAWAVRPDRVTRAYVTAGVGYIPYALAFGSVGVVALAVGLAPAAPDASDVAPLAASTYLPLALRLAYILLVVAAACSSCDTGLSAFGALVMNDIYRAHINPAATDRQMLRVARWSLAAFAAAVASLAMRRVALLEVVFFLGAAKGAMLFPLVATLYWRRQNVWGFAAGTLGGMAIGSCLFLLLRDSAANYRVLSTSLSVVMGAVLSIAVTHATGARTGRS